MELSTDLSHDLPVAAATPDARASFITRTYLHLLGAIVAFTLLEVVLFQSGLARPIAFFLLRGSWLWVLGGFVLVSWLATQAAHRASSPVAQYGALGAYVVAEAVIFVPLLFVAQFYAGGVIESAALVTLIGFSALTLVVFTTRKNFSFLGGLLRWGGMVALLLIVAGALFGFELGTFFSVGMVALAGGAILHDTSNILHEYPEDRHVGAALSLFASVALLF